MGVFGYLCWVGGVARWVQGGNLYFSLLPTHHAMRQCSRWSPASLPAWEVRGRRRLSQSKLVFLSASFIPFSHPRSCQAQIPESQSPNSLFVSKYAMWGVLLCKSSKSAFLSRKVHPPKVVEVARVTGFEKLRCKLVICLPPGSIAQHLQGKASTTLHAQVCHSWQRPVCLHKEWRDGPCACKKVIQEVFLLKPSLIEKAKCFGGFWRWSWAGHWGVCCVVFASMPKGKQPAHWGRPRRLMRCRKSTQHLHTYTGIYPYRQPTRFGTQKDIEEFNNVCTSSSNYKHVWSLNWNWGPWARSLHLSQEIFCEKCTEGMSARLCCLTSFTLSWLVSCIMKTTTWPERTSLNLSFTTDLVLENQFFAVQIFSLPHRPMEEKNALNFHDVWNQWRDVNEGAQLQ